MSMTIGKVPNKRSNSGATPSSWTIWSRSSRSTAIARIHSIRNRCNQRRNNSPMLTSLGSMSTSQPTILMGVTRTQPAKSMIMSQSWRSCSRNTGLMEACLQRSSSQWISASLRKISSTCAVCTQSRLTSELHSKSSTSAKKLRVAWSHSNLKLKNHKLLLKNARRLAPNKRA